MKTRQIKFIYNAVKWFDKVNGNTYHSVRITRCKDGQTLVGQFQYGYGESYQQTALEVMSKNNWLPKKYSKKLNNLYLYTRENNYPILWNVSQGLKRDCIANGSI